MADSSTVVPSDDEFRTALLALRTQAQAHNVDPNDDNVAAFINHQSEVMAQLRATVRQLEHRQHKISGV